MVPVLNQIPTDAACVGVSMGSRFLQTNWLAWSYNVKNILKEMVYRIMISILGSPNSSIYDLNVGFRGFWQTF